MNSHYIHNILRYIYILFRFMFVAALFIGIGCLIYYVTKLAYPFIIALIMAFFINPIVNLLETRAKFPRGLAALTVILVIFSMIIGIITLLVFEIVDGVNYLTKVVPQHVQSLVNDMQTFFFDKIQPLYEQYNQMMKSLGEKQQQTIQENLQNLGTNAANTITELGTNLLKGLQNFISFLPTFLTVLVFILLATFFICKDWYKIAAYLRKKFPDKVVDNGTNIYVELRKAFLGFIRAQLTLISMTAVIVLVGLVILQVDHAFTIAIVAGVIDLMPYLGTGVVFIPWIIYNFFTENYFLTIGLAILYGVAVIQRQMMEPKILSTSIGLDPLPTLIALFVGFQLFGFFGLIIGPTALVIFNTLAHANVFRDMWSYIIGKKNFPK
ncbi:sporulation integral membrane protein YtvI [Tuberibacillus sp. Marseille-P3662]|uniref:sporulation integral membrane protein YtvI n=1 Tax=Tuberibacillus sp. Marseille-P3662 TaxID=1965358 RepID=UPI000A1C9148|nr:sporulation integral membrane protein YtvI [Tuberibacillus sp. Marseille-P3662]